MAKKKQFILLEPGETFELKGQTFEVMHVSGQGDEGAMHHFQYEIQLQSEAEEKRQVEADRAAEERKAAVKAARQAEIDEAKAQGKPTAAK